MVPVGFTAFVDNVTAAVVPEPLMTRLPVPVMPPLKVRRFVRVGASVRLLFRVTPPLKILAALLVMLKVPLEPVATVIGWANVPANPPFSVALALPLLSPSVITLALAPKAFALVVPLTLPALISNPLVNVFAPESVSCDVALSCTTPVTLVPMMALMSVEPVPVPELVTVPVGLTLVVDSVMPLAIALLLLSTRLPVPVTPPETVSTALPPALLFVR